MTNFEISIIVEAENEDEALEWLEKRNGLHGEYFDVSDIAECEDDDGDDED